MKKTLIAIFMIVVQVCTMAQTTQDVELCLRAEEAYRIGRLEEAIELLEGNISELTNRTLETAYRLLSLCYMEKDQDAKARSYAELLLKENPYFTVNLSDPIRFADMIENMKRGKSATITTASQQAETIEEAPVPVTLITEDMIKASGAHNLKEVLLAYVPGLTEVVSNEEYNISMRGVYSSGQEKILIMLNGHRLNSYSTNTAVPDYTTSLDKVKQIEVLRGPASSLYGGVALTAVVNIITKTALDIEGMELKAGIGNYGQALGSVLFGKQYFDLKLIGWGSIYNAQGQKINIPTDKQSGLFPVDGNIIVGGYRDKPTYDCGINLQWMGFGLLYNTTYSNYVSPYTLSMLCAPYDYESYRTIDGNGPGFSKKSNHLEASYSYSSNHLGLKIKVNYDSEIQSRYQVVGDTVPNFGINEVVPPGTNDTLALTRGAFQSSRWQEYTFSSAIHGTYLYNINDINVGSINFGGEYARFTLDDSYYVEGDHYDRILATYDESKNLRTGTENMANVFLQFKNQYKQLFIFNAGIRYDFKKRNNGKTINEISPRAALIFLRPKWNFKLSYSKSFVDAPYYYRNNTFDTSQGAENLLSEYLHSFQLTFLGNKLVRGAEFEANMYYNKATDFIKQNIYTIDNAGKYESLGIELSASYKKKNFSGWINTSWQHLLSADDYAVYDGYVLNIPKVSSNLILAYKLLKNLCIKAHINYLSKQKYSIQAFDMVNYTYHELPSRITVDSGIIYNYKRCSFDVQINNIFNHKYEQGGTSYIPIKQKGTWFTICASVKL